MLVLSRKIGESILLYFGGETVRLTVTNVKSSTIVQIGFEASQNVNIVREELLDKKESNLG